MATIPRLRLPALTSVPSRASSDPAASMDGADWLQQAALRDHKPKSKKKGAGALCYPLPKPAKSALSWMSAMKRRSSMDLEDEAVEAAVAQAKAAAVPGGWLTMGTLGAPDAAEEEKALEEAWAASSLAR